jgi:hypothetical protein
MCRALRSIAWLGTVAGVLALIGVGAALVIGIAVYVVGLEALDLPPVGGTLLLVPVGMAVGGAVLWALSKLVVRAGGESGPAEPTPAAHTAEGDQPPTPMGQPTCENSPRRTSTSRSSSRSCLVSRPRPHR